MMNNEEYYYYYDDDCSYNPDYEQSRLLEMIHASEEQQDLETALAISLQEYLLTTLTTRRTNKNHPCRDSSLGGGSSMGNVMALFRQQEQLEQNRILELQVQQEQCRILERIRQEQQQQQQERHGRSSPSSSPRTRACGTHLYDYTPRTQDREVYVHQQLCGDERREERRRRRYDDSTPRFPGADPTNSPQQGVDRESSEEPPRVVTITRGPHFQEGWQNVSSITTTSSMNNGTQEEVRQDPRNQAAIEKVGTINRKQPKRKALRRWNVNLNVFNQQREEEESGMQVRNQEEENRILQRLLQQQQQRRTRETRRRRAPLQQQQESPRHVEMAFVEPVPTQPSFSDVHLEPPKVVAIPQGPLQHWQTSHVSTITMDTCTAHEDGQGKILIKLGRLLRTRSQILQANQSNDLIVTCEGCASRLQVDCCYSLVFCPKCHTISSAVPVARVTF